MLLLLIEQFNTIITTDYNVKTKWFYLIFTF